MIVLKKLNVYKEVETEEKALLLEQKGFTRVSKETEQTDETKEPKQVDETKEVVEIDLSDSDDETPEKPKTTRARKK